MEALMIGVSGMRGTVGGTLTPPVVTRMAAAFAAWLKQNEQPANGTHFRVVFGRDSRPSGLWVRDAAAAALVASGVEVIDLDVVTTPGVAMMVKHTGADAGIVATASHNPIQWNGLKFLNRDAHRPAAGARRARSKRLYDAASATRATSRVEHAASPPTRNSETHALHVKRMLDHVDVLGISTQAVQGRARQRQRRRLRRDARRCSASSAASSSTSTPRPTASSPTSPSRPRRTSPASPTKSAGRRPPSASRRTPTPTASRSSTRTARYIGEEYSLALAAKLICSKKPGGVAVAEPLDQPDDRRHRRPARRARRPHARRRGQRHPGDAPRRRRHRRRRQRRRHRPPHRPRPRQPRRHGVRPPAHGRHRQDGQPARRRAAALRDRQDQVRVPPRGRRPRGRGAEEGVRVGEGRHAGRHPHRLGSRARAGSTPARATPSRSCASSPRRRTARSRRSGSRAVQEVVDAALRK